MVTVCVENNYREGIAEIWIEGEGQRVLAATRNFTNDDEWDKIESDARVIASILQCPLSIYPQKKSATQGEA
jgi:hypothetical protein